MTTEEISYRLKSARDGSGLTLAQINERTKIPFNHLESIEQGHFDDLPEPVYVAGFIKRYADCVGLDGQQMANEYRQELDQQFQSQTEKPGIFKKHKSNSHHNIPTQPAYYTRQPIEQAPPNLIKMIPFYAFWVVALLGLVVYLVNYVSNRQESMDMAQQDPGILGLKQGTNQGTNKAQPVVPELAQNDKAENVADNTNTSAANDTDNSQPDESASSDTNQAVLLAKKHVWVEVKAISSGEALYTGFMEAGTNHNFSDSEGLHIRAGNGGNVQVTFAGKTEDLGGQGKISERNFLVRANQAASAARSAPTKKKEKLAHAQESTSETEKPEAGGTSASPAVSTTEKPAEKTAEKPASVKKPLVAASAHKPVTSSTQSHKFEGAGENKSLDVPYRYND